MMKRRLLTYCILLVLSFINIKAMASNETHDLLSSLSCISTETHEQADQRMQLKGTDVEVNIYGSIAEVIVRKQYKNNSDQILSGRYTFPAPERALVHDMEMKTNETIFTAKVKEQKKALEEFHRIKEEGKNVILLNQEKPEIFSMDMANLMPGETIDVEYRYTELLIPNDMRYKFVYPADKNTEYPGQPDAEFDIAVNISAGIPIQELMCSSHETDIIIDTESSAKVILKGQAKKGNNTDYILNYRLTEKKMRSGLILSGGNDEKYLLFNDYVGAPGLKDISVRFTDLKTYDIEPSVIPDLSAPRPVTLLAKWEGEADGLVKVEGRRMGRNYSKTYRFIKNNSRNLDGALEHLWAGKRIERLSNNNTADGNRNIDSEITSLGLKHNVLTKNTSLIVYNDIVRKAVTPVEKDEELLPAPEEEPMPEPVRIAKVPEPDFYV
ncbi:MAG: hypothetical protein JXL81_04185, partial [Deltaproteobacteria bacterium]|nr:hypothetical protein [Deltaproteobacteria bacterium]